MDTWLYNIKRWWGEHGRNIKRYGLCVMIILAGLHDNWDYFTAWIGLLLAIAFAAYDRFDGAYWQQRGQEVLYPTKFAPKPKEEQPPRPPTSPPSES